MEYDHTLQRAREVRSKRQGALRYENISDEEVREIRAATSDVVLKSIVNISGVTLGCPCEDGAGCADQVWIVAERESRSIGLMLSLIDGHWTIGPVQQWWLEYDKLRSRKFPSHTTYLEAESELVGRFPRCAATYR